MVLNESLRYLDDFWRITDLNWKTSIIIFTFNHYNVLQLLRSWKEPFLLKVKCFLQVNFKIKLTFKNFDVIMVFED